MDVDIFLLLKEVLELMMILSNFKELVKQEYNPFPNHPYQGIKRVDMYREISGKEKELYSNL
jgi:hypothetical protein